MFLFYGREPDKTSRIAPIPQAMPPDSAVRIGRGCLVLVRALPCAAKGRRATPSLGAFVPPAVQAQQHLPLGARPSARRRIGPPNLDVLERYGLRGCAPDGDARGEALDFWRWDKALDRIGRVLCKRGVLHEPGAPRVLNTPREPAP